MTYFINTCINACNTTCITTFIGARTAPIARLVCTICLLCGSVIGRAEEPISGLEGPDITIIAGEERTIYEYRQNGFLRMVKIEPNWGKAYYLVPSDQTQPYDDLNQSDMLVPSWVIVEF